MAAHRMNLNDLELLVRAVSRASASADTYVCPGEAAAARRLSKAGLVEHNAVDLVKPTRAGVEMVDRLAARLEVLCGREARR